MVQDLGVGVSPALRQKREMKDKISKLTGGATTHRIYRAVGSELEGELPLARLNFFIIHIACVEIVRVIYKIIMRGTHDEDKGPIPGLFWIKWALEAVDKEDDAGNLSILGNKHPDVRVAANAIIVAFKG